MTGNLGGFDILYNAIKSIGCIIEMYLNNLTTLILGPTTCVQARIRIYLIIHQ